jgi:hypothetical protein
MISFIDEGLCCPHCHFNYLHHSKIEVFGREEDAVMGLHSVITRQDITTNHSMKGNPSQRRDGIKIYFWCEGCSIFSILEIIQHKGMTYVRWQGE